MMEATSVLTPYREEILAILGSMDCSRELSILRIGDILRLRTRCLLLLALHEISIKLFKVMN